jgi:hypothetical protein
VRKISHLLLRPTIKSTIEVSLKIIHPGQGFNNQYRNQEEGVIKNNY